MAHRTESFGAELTREQIQAVINQKLENTLYWLNKAYEVRPQDSPSEKALLDLMAGLQRLKREVNDTILNKARSDHPSLQRSAQERAKI